MKKSFDTEDAGVFVRPIYIDAVGGDHMAAMMLAQIIYWYRPNEYGKSKLRKFSEVDGVKTWWLVKSHVDWFDELRMSRGQSQRCLRVLKQRGLVETWNTLFDGHPTVHVRCTLIKGNVLSNADLAAFHCALKSNPLHEIAQSITETTTETTTKTLEPVGASPTAPAQALSVGTGHVKNSGDPTPYPLPKEPTMNASELLAQHKQQWASTLANTPTPATASAVATRWRHQCVGAGMGIKSTLTGKEAGQFKLLFKALGPQSNEVVDYVFANWMKFTGKVGSMKGVEVLPSSPVVGFVLQHYDVALQLIAKQAEDSKEIVADSIDKPDIVCNATKTVEEEKYIPSAAELEAAFAELDSLAKKD